MRYDNEMKITMRTAKMAEKAMETLKNRLAAGFDRDKEYTRNPAIRFAEELQSGRIAATISLILSAIGIVAAFVWIVI